MANLNDFFNLQGGGLGTPISTVETTDFAALAAQNGGSLYLCDCIAAGQAITVTMPEAPEIGDMVFVGDYNAGCSVNTPIVISSGELIHGSNENLIVTAANVALVFQYVDATIGWKIIDGIGEENSPPGYESVLLWSGTISADNASVSWLTSQRILSEFDEIIFTLQPEMYLLGQSICEVRLRPEQLLSAVLPVLLFHHTEPGTGTRYTIISLTGVTETGATFNQEQSVFVSTLKEIRGISYSK